MSERKSTPGPWRVCDEFVLAGGEGREGRVVKRVDGESHCVRCVKSDQQRANEQQAFLAACREKILYRVPGLNSDEQRRLWEIASGQSLPPERKRCAACGADGCAVCEFTGYVLE